MIVKVNRTGTDSELCQAHVSLPRGWTTIQLMSIRLPDNAAIRFPEFLAAVTANNITFDIPAQKSISKLVSFMNAIVAPGRVFECWYNSNTRDFELATISYNTVTISAEFAAYFEFPATTIVSFDSGRINPSSDPVHEYVVEVDAHIDGASEGAVFTQAIGYVDGPRGKPFDSNAFLIKDSANTVSVRVKYRLKTGELSLCSCDTDQMWSVCLRLN